MTSSTGKRDADKILTDKIIKMHRQGHLNTKISAVLGIPTPTVCSRLNQRGFKSNRRAKTDNGNGKTRINKRYNENNPDIRSAHKAVENALISGRLEKHPCKFCKCERVEAHHPDYAFPLLVVWVCPECHRALHEIEKLSQ